MKQRQKRKIKEFTMNRKTQKVGTIIYFLEKSQISHKCKKEKRTQN